jgi:hypothetical protein
VVAVAAVVVFCLYLARNAVIRQDRPMTRLVTALAAVALIATAGAASAEDWTPPPAPLTQAQQKAANHALFMKCFHPGVWALPPAPGCPNRAATTRSFNSRLGPGKPCRGIGKSAGRVGGAAMTDFVNQRAWDLYRDIQLQRATLKTYQEALFFVRVRQTGADRQSTERIAQKLWEIAERMRGDMNPSYG